MPIIDLQRRLAEKGRIRLGEKRQTANGTSYPAKLDRFRFTSPDRTVIDELARMYGGTVTPWEQQWQVVTDTTSVPVMVIPTDMGFTQWYEDWTGGVCKKRCDGDTDHVRDVACDCDPDNRTCKITTRLSVILPDLKGLGTWRIETHGWYAGVELAGAVNTVEMAGAMGAMLPARLRLEGRKVKRLIDNKVQPRDFVVPVLDLDVSARQLAGLGGGGSPIAPAAAVGVGGEGPATALPSPTPPPPTPTPPAPNTWRPVDQEALPAGPIVSVADQLDEINRPKKAAKKRANAAAPIPATGRAPRTAAATICHLCGDAYGEGALVKNPSDEGNKFVHKTCADAMDTPAPQPGGKTGGGGGTASGPPPAKPAPAATPMPMTHAMHRKLMAVTADAFPIDPTATSSADASAMRKANVQAIARQFGIEIESRTDLDRNTGSLIIDALEGIKAGTYRFVDDRLIEADSGAVVTPEGAS